MRGWLACIAAVFLAACAELPLPQDAATALGPPLERFSAEGRISLRQGERRSHLRFRWEHGPGKDSVLLMSPLGQGIAELSRDATGARLQQPNRLPQLAGDLRQLALDVFGTPLPLEALAYWMRGARADLRGNEDGWRVNVREVLLHHHSRLPRVLDAAREDVELTLIMDDWDTGD